MSTRKETLQTLQTLRTQGECMVTRQSQTLQTLHFFGETLQGKTASDLGFAGFAGFAGFLFTLTHIHARMRAHTIARSGVEMTLQTMQTLRTAGQGLF